MNTKPANGVSSPTSAASGRIDDIECLRAIAVIGVLLHHFQGPLFYWFPKWHPSWLGNIYQHLYFGIGVDLFFAISGFVIARSLLPQLAEAAASGKQWRMITGFWVRRAFRLLPSAWIWLGLIMLCVVFFNSSGAFGSLHANVWATLAGLANVANFRFADAFLTYEYGASFSYWTLSLEEQFYFLLPITAWLLRKHLCWLMLLLIALQFVIIRTPLGMSIRTDALAWGVLLAMIHGGPVWKRIEPTVLGRRWVRYPILLMLFGMMAWLPIDPNPWTLNWRMGLVAIFCVVIVWIASYSRGYVCGEGRIKQVLMWIGSRSYAIYLIHIPAYFFVRECFWRLGMAGDPPPPYSSFIYAATAMLLIGLLAEANYRWVETPLRERGVRLARRLQQRDFRADSPDTPTNPLLSPVNPPCQN